MNRKTFVVLSAAFGGISPNLFRLAVSLTKEGAELPGWSYLLGLLIFAVMGAVVALIWEETDFKKAFYLGIGLPAFIQMSAGEISTTEMAVLHQEAIHNLAAYERSGEQPYSLKAVSYRQQESRKLEITFKKFISRYSVIFTSPDSTSEEIIALRVGRLNRTVPVPSFATSFKLKIAETESTAHSLPEEAEKPLRYEVTIEEGMWGGFLKAIGIKGDRDITITVRKLPG